MSRMSQDRVRFTLPQRYYLKSRGRKSNGMEFKDCAIVLQQAFGFPVEMEHTFWIQQLNANRMYLSIECRPSQFARFIVRRMEMMDNYLSGTNGIKDLAPHLCVPTRTDGFSLLQQETGFDRDTVRTLVHALKLNMGDVEEILTKDNVPEYLDVSDFHNHRTTL